MQEAKCNNTPAIHNSK